MYIENKALLSIIKEEVRLILKENQKSFELFTDGGTKMTISSNKDLLNATLNATRRFLEKNTSLIQVLRQSGSSEFTPAKLRDIAKNELGNIFNENELFTIVKAASGDSSANSNFILNLIINKSFGKGGNKELKSFLLSDSDFKNQFSNSILSAEDKNSPSETGGTINQSIKEL